MTLQDLGNLGDFIGGIAVVVTLIYLALQIRQNTRSLRSAALDSAADQFAQRQLAIAQDPDLADLIERGAADFSALAGVERRRYRSHFLAHLKYVESASFKREENLLPRSQWDGQETALAYSFRRPGWQQCWNEVKAVFSAEFREYIDRVIIQRAGDGPAAQQGAAAARLPPAPIVSGSFWLRALVVVSGAFPPAGR